LVIEMEFHVFGSLGPAQTGSLLLYTMIFALQWESV
jgi:hypothetical protein